MGLSKSKGIADKGLAEILDTDKKSQLEAVQTFAKWQDKAMPTAACYTLLKKNTELIVKLTCNVCGKTTNGAEIGDCLRSHINGKVKITLTEEESGGTYTAVIYSG